MKTFIKQKEVLVLNKRHNSFISQLKNHISSTQIKDKQILFTVIVPSINTVSQKKFSIKSFVGSTPTLFNANKTTNIIYQIVNSNGHAIPQELAASINAITIGHKYVDKVKAIIDNGYTIQFNSF